MSSCSAQPQSANPLAHCEEALIRCARNTTQETPLEIWELIAREEIRELIAAYAHCADGGRFDDLVALFAEDGVLETPDGTEHRGRGAIRAFLGATKADLAAATTAGWIRHHVSTLRLAVSGRSDASGAAYFFVITERGPDHWGRYRDRYVCRDGRWLFAHRRVRLDGSASTSWVAQRRDQNPA